MNKINKLLQKLDTHKYNGLLGGRPFFMFYANMDDGVTELQVCLGEHADYIASENAIRLLRDLADTLEGIEKILANK